MIIQYLAEIHDMIWRKRDFFPCLAVFQHHTKGEACSVRVDAYPCVVFPSFLFLQQSYIMTSPVHKTI